MTKEEEYKKVIEKIKGYLELTNPQGVKNNAVWIMCKIALEGK
jgi:hypothetical protein